MLIIYQISEDDERTLADIKKNNVVARRFCQ